MMTSLSSLWKRSGLGDSGLLSLLWTTTLVCGAHFGYMLLFATTSTLLSLEGRTLSGRGLSCHTVNSAEVTLYFWGSVSGVVQLTERHPSQLTARLQWGS